MAVACYKTSTALTLDTPGTWFQALATRSAGRPYSTGKGRDEANGGFTEAYSAPATRLHPQIWSDGPSCGKVGRGVRGLLEGSLRMLCGEMASELDHLTDLPRLRERDLGRVMADMARMLR